MSKKLFLLLSLFIMFPKLVYLQPTGDPSSKMKESTSEMSPYAQSANYRTALRCLELSKQFLFRSEWTNAASQAELGCAYNDSISDLWYVAAESKYQSGAIPATVLPLIAKAIEKNNWVDANQSNARLLYAKLLCDIGNCTSALEQLDKEPVLYSAEAEYIRILSYYRLGTEESVATAREKVSAAVRLFPEDNRFPLVFFTHELKEDLSYDIQVSSLASSLVQRYVEPYGISAELAIYATAFAEEELQLRMLKAFNASGLRHPLYPLVSLKAGLLTEKEAYEYYCTFAENEMHFSSLVQFLSFLQDASVKQAFKAYLTAYNGTILLDISNDKIPDMTIQYLRGRPQSVVYDNNQDGIVDFSANCDYGVPYEIVFEKEKMTLEYKRYPSLSSVDVKGANFILVADTMEWSPITLYASEPIMEYLDGFQFFIPKPVENIDLEELTYENILKAVSSIIVPTKERENATVRFTVLDGKFRYGQYFCNEKPYAQLSFESGYPSVRTVDMDGDGKFELTEQYKVFIPQEDQVYEKDKQLYERLFGYCDFPDGVYLSSVFVDLDLDTKNDFMVEYSLDGGSISMWNDSEGRWVSKFQQFPDLNKTEASFRMPVTNDVVTVFIEKEVPSKVAIQNKNGEILRDLAVYLVDDVYWIGEKADSQISAQLKSALAQDGRQGVCLVLDYQTESGETKVFTAVRINGYNFGVYSE